MRKRSAIAIAAAITAAPTWATSPAFVDVTATALPQMDPDDRSMHAAAIDVDGDGDLDVVIAREFGRNAILINDGSGRFADESNARLPIAIHDSEEVVAADFNGDGAIDLLFVSEDDRVHELYFSDGSGRFSDESQRIPLRSVANGAAILDVNDDGAPDIVLANNGANAILVNDGVGNFIDESAARLPDSDAVSQDVEVGDVNGDGFADLVFANEGANSLLLNDGNGVFARSRGLPNERLTESRMAALADVDQDGDLDLFFANVALFVRGADPQNQLFINDGDGNFTEETAERLPSDNASSFEGKIADLDGDGDLDIIVGNTNALAAPGNARVRTYLNDAGHFIETDALLPVTANGNVFGMVVADFNGDGESDLFLALRYGGDRLFIRQ